MQREHQDSETPRGITRQVGLNWKIDSNSEERRCETIQNCLHETLESTLAETAKHLFQRRNEPREFEFVPSSIKLARIVRGGVSKFTRVVDSEMTMHGVHTGHNCFQSQRPDQVQHLLLSTFTDPHFRLNGSRKRFTTHSQMESSS